MLPPNFVIDKKIGPDTRNPVFGFFNPRLLSVIDYHNFDILHTVSLYLNNNRDITQDLAAATEITHRSYRDQL